MFEWIFNPIVDSGVPEDDLTNVIDVNTGSLVDEAAQDAVRSIADNFDPRLIDVPPGAEPSVADSFIDPSAFAGGGAELFGPAAVPGLGATMPLGKELFYRPDTGEVVNAAGQKMIDREPLQLVAGIINGTVKSTPDIIDRIVAGLKPVETFLGTKTGNVLAMLGLGAAGLGIGRAAAGSGQPFRPPARIGSLADNPAAIAVQNQIRMNALEQLRRAGIDPTGTAGTLDPITAMLTDRLQKAFAGEVSNPVLERANRKEQDRLQNEVFQKWGRWGDDSTPAAEKKVLLDESQAIRAYLDNQNTINQLAPMQGSRLRETLGFQANLAGLDRLGAEQQSLNDLNERLAFQAWQQENADRANTARSIANLFGMVADRGLSNQRPWDRPTGWSG